MELTRAIRRLFGAERETGGILQETPPEEQAKVNPTKGFDEKNAIPSNFLQDRLFIRRKAQRDPYFNAKKADKFQIGDENYGDRAYTTSVGQALKKRYVDLCAEVRVPQRYLVKAVLASMLDNYEGMLKSRLPYCKTRKEVEACVKECFTVPLVRLV